MRISKLLIALALLISACSTTKSTYTSLPIGDYQDYQVSDTSDSLSSYPPDDEYAYLTTIKSSDEHSATIYTLSAQTTLKVPLGWYGIEEGDRAVFMLEDKYTRFTLGFRSLEGKTFEEFKNSYIDVFKEFYPTLKDEDIYLEEISATQFYLIARHLPTETGTENGIVNVITYNPNLEGKSLDGHYHSLLLVTPEDTFEHFLGLIGLIVRDQEIDWVY